MMQNNYQNTMHDLPRLPLADKYARLFNIKYYKMSGAGNTAHLSKQNTFLALHKCTDNFPRKLTIQHVNSQIFTEDTRFLT